MFRLLIIRICGVFCLVTMMGLLIKTEVQAACLLAYDNGAPLVQGIGIARLSSQGGTYGFAGHAEGRLGLSGDRELHLRIGACQRSSLNSFAFETGLTQRLIAHHHDPAVSQAFISGPIDLSLRASIVSLRSSDDQNDRTDLGFQSVLVVSYPINLTPKQRGGIALSVGGSVASSDQVIEYQLVQGLDKSFTRRITSEFIWSEIIALSLNLEVMNDVSLALELRWQDEGFTAGGGIGYLF